MPSTWFGRGNTRAIIITAGAVAALATPIAVAQQGDGPKATAAAGEGDAIEGGVRNPSANETQALTRETEIIANTSTYGTRQSNKSNNGGGAIYGCRSGAGGTAAKNEPCVRANNLSTGLAFEFESDGDLIGTFTTSKPGDASRPFTTNATGVATGLNADRVDGASAEDIVKAAVAAATPRWVLVNEAGQIEAQSGGFTVRSAYSGGDGPGGNQNVYIDTGEDVRVKGLTATIAGQNSASEQANDNFAGEVAIAACGSDEVACAPEGTDNANTIVVAPRDSDGTTTTSTDRKRFYVTITR